MELHVLNRLMSFLHQSAALESVLCFSCVVWVKCCYFQCNCCSLLLLWRTDLWLFFWKDLGSAAGSKRPTCVILIKPHQDYQEAYDECLSEVSELPKPLWSAADRGTLRPHQFQLLSETSSDAAAFPSTNSWNLIWFLLIWTYRAFQFLILLNKHDGPRTHGAVCLNESVGVGLKLQAPPSLL